MTTNAGQATGSHSDGASRSTSGAIVDLRNLSRSFGTTRALDGLSLRLAPGELVALLGPSGCGKTTALRIVAGFETADSGTVEVDGKDVSPVPAAKRDMGMVFQSYSLFPNMSAVDNVSFGLRMRRLGSAERQRRAADLLDMVGLAPQAKQYPHQLSGGQQQRVALARALANEPSVLLADEPTGNLDSSSTRDVLRLLRRAHDQGQAILMVTHDARVASLADRVINLFDGMVADDVKMVPSPRRLGGVGDVVELRG